MDAGFVLVPEKSNLSVVRTEIVASAAEDEELPEEVSFLADTGGKFTFYLDYGKARVKKAQEPKVRMQDAEAGLCVMADGREDAGQ